LSNFKRRGRSPSFFFSFFNLKSLLLALCPCLDFFPSRRHLQILDILKFSILHGSQISVIVGEPGVGKTQALLTLLERLPKDKYHKVEILPPALSSEELLKSIFWGMKTSHFARDEISHHVIPRHASAERPQGVSPIGVIESKALGDSPYPDIPSNSEASTPHLSCRTKARHPLAPPCPADR